jgi:hypothetical protein
MQEVRHRRGFMEIKKMSTLSSKLTQNNYFPHHIIYCSDDFDEER